MKEEEITLEIVDDLNENLAKEKEMGDDIREQPCPNLVVM